jgi:hypothetical protein
VVSVLISREESSRDAVHKQVTELQLLSSNEEKARQLTTVRPAHTVQAKNIGLLYGRLFVSLGTLKVNVPINKQ